MRSIVVSVVSAAVVALALLALVPFAPAGAAPEQEGVTSERVETLERQVKLLQDEVAYLLLREDALTRGAVAADATSRTLLAGVAAARRDGFEAAAIPAAARAALLRSLEGLGRDLSAAVPAPTAAEARMQKDLAARRRSLVAAR